MYCTVRRGAITIYENRLTIVGWIQPKLLLEMASKGDAQGLLDRKLFIPAEYRGTPLKVRIISVPDEVGYAMII